MLRIKGLNKSFKKKKVLHDIDLKLENGVYGLLGENGAGKTTLMRCIAHLYDFESGEVFLKTGDKEIRDFSDKTGYLPQSFEGLEELRVDEFLRYFADMKGLKKQDREHEIEQVLNAVHLSEKRKERMCTLSGGMKRRIGIAQTLLGKPKLLMFDEPTTGLDPKERIRFQNIIAENRKLENITLISTHIVSDIEYMSDVIIVMKEGRILGCYTPMELAGEAEGKVYELTEEEYEKVQDRVFLIKISQNIKERRMRVMTSEPMKAPRAAATVEDGYLWVSSL